MTIISNPDNPNPTATNPTNPAAPAPPSATLQDLLGGSQAQTPGPEPAPAGTPAPPSPAAPKSIDEQLEELRKKKEADLQAELDKEKAKLEEKAKKEQEKADKAEAKKAEAKKAREEKKAKEDAEKAAALAHVKPVEVKPPAESIIKTLESGKASAALKAAFTAENNAELGYKTLGARYGWSVKGLIDDLVNEGQWPTVDEKDASGKVISKTPWGYKKLYEFEKSNKLVSWGFMVNRASERFTMLNPENIKKREEAAEAARKAKAEEEAAQKKAAQELAEAKAKGLIPETATTKTTTSTTSNKVEVAGMEPEQRVELAKQLILSLPDELANALFDDPEIQHKLNLDGSRD